MNAPARCIICLALVVIGGIGATSATLVTCPNSAPSGPDVVMLKELETQYQPVAFDHRSHAKMAEMWQRCTACHHRKPLPTTRSATTRAVPSQEESASVPACKSCHPRSEPTAISLRMPSLKGAYHRQCLNCHREWMHNNACLICHEAKDRKAMATAVATTTRLTNLPTPDDLTGRMHPPIPEPTTKPIRVRFSAADGRNVLFRHREHAHDYGLKCASCHHEDSCASCHEKRTSGEGPRPMSPARTWVQSHEPCVGCHKENRCRHCHYQDGQTAPPPFDHASTGQTLDSDHKKLACQQCHTTLRSKVDLKCGDARCHPRNPAIAFPADRPGPFKAPVKLGATFQPATTTFAPTTRPSTRPTILRIRVHYLDNN